MTQEARNVDAERACGIVFLRPYDARNACPSDAHPGKTLFPNRENDVKYDARNNAWFSGGEMPCIGIRHLHNIIRMQADEGLTFAIRGGLLRPGARFFSRRKSVGDGRRMPGIAPVERRWLALDIDALPNPKGHDPRRDPQAAAEWIRSLLPGELSRATLSFGWSSSCCARNPAGLAPHTLSCRVWLWLTEALDEQNARRVMRRIGAEVSSTLAAEGVECGPRVVDAATATANQPIYIARPKFGGGLTDPLPDRHLLLEGEVDVVDPAPLLVQTVVPVVARARKAGEARVAAERPQGPVLPVIPLAAGWRLLEARREAEDRRERRSEGYRDACFRLYQRRWPLELVSVVLYRRQRAEWGQQDCKDWLHGVPEGMRNEYAVMLSAGVVAALPTGLSEEKVRAEVRSLLRLIVPEAWVSAEWEGTADRSIISRYLKAPELGEATPQGPRYTYGKDTLVEALAISEDEVAALGLRSLASDAVRLRAQRAGDAAPRLAARAARDAEVVRLSLAGLSLREISEQTGVSKSTAHRAVAAYAKAAWQRAVTAQRLADEAKRAGRGTVEPTEAEALAAERKAVVKAARDALQALAKVSGLPVTELRGHVADWLQEERRRAA